MEPIETRTEEIAGQIAANADSVETPVTDQADEAAVVQNDAKQVTAITAEDSTEAMENVVEEAAVVESTVEEAVVESTSVILADTAIDTTEPEMIETSMTTEQPNESSDSPACPLDGCPNWVLIGGIIIIGIVAAVIIKRLKRKTGTGPGTGATDTANGSNVVEIYVGNLSYDMVDNQLRKEFERFGVVKSARVITHRTNNKSKGYGFVEMPHRKEALIAIKALENAEVMGRRIRVNEARANTRPSDR